MQKHFLIALSLLFMTACLPRVVPAAEPIFYQAKSEDLYASVIKTIATSPGLDDSNGWLISQSDTTGGFVRVETTVKAFFEEPVTHHMTVVVRQSDNSKSYVVIQGSQEARALKDRVIEQLDQTFLRAE